MGLGDLTDRKAVLKASEEFDDMGREAFLAKYGFGSTRLRIFHEGRYYDSKAIVGAAHGYQRRSMHPLHAWEFSGGKGSVGRKLKKLGFTVETVPGINNIAFADISYDADAAGAHYEDKDGYPEGKLAYCQHVIRERNPSVVRKAKKLFKKRHGGKLLCQVCGFDFHAVYGNRGKGFIEGHHTVPVSKMKEGDKTSPKDIAMLCSNCHRMIHQKPAVTVKQLAKQIDRRNS